MSFDTIDLGDELGPEPAELVVRALGADVDARDVVVRHFGHDGLLVSGRAGEAVDHEGGLEFGAGFDCVDGEGGDVVLVLLVVVLEADDGVGELVVFLSDGAARVEDHTLLGGNGFESGAGVGGDVFHVADRVGFVRRWGFVEEDAVDGEVGFLVGGPGGVGGDLVLYFCGIARAPERVDVSDELGVGFGVELRDSVDPVLLWDLAGRDTWAGVGVHDDVEVDTGVFVDLVVEGLPCAGAGIEVEGEENVGLEGDHDCSYAGRSMPFVYMCKVGESK